MNLLQAKLELIVGYGHGYVLTSKLELIVGYGHGYVLTSKQLGLLATDISIKKILAVLGGGTVLCWSSI